MSLSRCGRVYPTFDEAYKAALLRTEKSGKEWKVGCCPLADHYHVVWPGSVLAVRKPVRLDPFPPFVQRQIIRRDDMCQGCGYEGRVYKHHRRAKASGGSKAREHTQCACNGILLCWRCHEWAHLHPAKARDVGLIVSQSAKRPALVAVTRMALAVMHNPDLAIWPDVFYATCDGRWVHSPLETED